LVIYGEYLFIENTVTGFIILSVTANILHNKIMTTKLGKTKMAAGSIFCGIFSFVIFIKMNTAVALITKLLFSVGLTYFVFGKRLLAKTLFVFYIASVVMGGISFAVIFLRDCIGISNNGFVYIGDITYLKIGIGIILSYIAMNYLVKLVYRKKEGLSFVKDVVVTIGKQVFNFKGYVDSGNSLTEALSGLPVSLLTEEMSDKVICQIGKEEYKKRLCIIPYTSVGTKKGILEGIKVDCMIIDNEDKGKAVLAFYKGKLSFELEAEGCEALLNKYVLREGL